MRFGPRWPCWLRLRIEIERIKPGHPQHDGRNERMHLTLKREATKPAAANVIQQQARFDIAAVLRYRGAPRTSPGERPLRVRLVPDLQPGSTRVRTLLAKGFREIAKL